MSCMNIMYVHRKISASLIGVSLSGTSWCVLSMDRSVSFGVSCDFLSMTHAV